ncbi:hypothetical protein GLOIN_2v1656253 [Rhizophagus irregularis DAOM 181602=DAOM 197198]|nr:hypothetical protein GLOIN_2v1656253 [Rhizophagus irregularis DAOM 181602=DAOM 197198]
MKILDNPYRLFFVKFIQNLLSHVAHNSLNYFQNLLTIHYGRHTFFYQLFLMDQKFL